MISEKNCIIAPKNVVEPCEQEALQHRACMSVRHVVCRSKFTAECTLNFPWGIIGIIRNEIKIKGEAEMRMWGSWDRGICQSDKPQGLKRSPFCLPRIAIFVSMNWVMLLSFSSELMAFKMTAMPKQHIKNDNHLHRPICQGSLVTNTLKTNVTICILRFYGFKYVAF